VTDFDVWHQTDEDSPYTEVSRAQVVLAATAQELADYARGFVRVYDDRPSALLVDDAARAVVKAQALLRAAVVAARAAHVSWEDLGGALDITKQSAHQRYAEDERQWKEALDRPEAVNEIGQRYSRLPYGAENTAAVAARLDEWALRHRQPTDVTGPHPQAPVSGGLRKMGPFDEQLDLHRRLRILWDDHIVPPAELVAALHEREAVLAERLADGGVDPTGNRKAATRSRTRAAEFRARAAAEAEAASKTTA
jgi:hypothetical protein